MFQDLWPQIPVWEVPIVPVTNGVHLPSWLNGDLATLYDRYLQPDWRERYPEKNVWDHIADIPDPELWEAHRRRKRQLVIFVRERQSQRALARRASASELKRISELLDPEAFTIGFARRFATYKRASLIFRDMNRLKRLLTNPAMPVQFLIAGKAHPKDQPGKDLIREIVQLSRDPDLARHIVFIEDYDIQVGRELCHGVDLWLNNPRRGEEACGTSGMKAGINGKLNLSILDGWFDEAYELSGGWAIGDREPYSEDQDEIHASAIYSLLETEVVPKYYKDREEGVPRAWVARMKRCLTNLSPLFNSQRMLSEYNTQLYEPAHQSYMKVREDSYQYVKEKARWNEMVERAWGHVRLKDGGSGLGPCILSGRPIELQASVDLAGLSPEDVRVEAVVGRVGVTGALEETSVLTLPPTGRSGGQFVFSKEFVPHQTGRLGYSLRVSPNHCDDPLTRPCRSKMKWSSE
jgi:glycogen phosphorylase